MTEPVPVCPECNTVLSEKTLDITFENVKAGFVRCRYCGYKIAVEGMGGIQKSLEALKRSGEQVGLKMQR